MKGSLYDHEKDFVTRRGPSKEIDLYLGRSRLVLTYVSVAPFCQRLCIRRTNFIFALEVAGHG